MNKITTLVIAVLAILVISEKSFSQGVSAPSGIASWGNIVYGGSGLFTPQPYARSGGQNAHMVLCGGVGLGDIKKLAVQVSTVALDVSQLDLYIFNFKLSRYLNNGNYIGFGVENFFMISGYNGFEFNEWTGTDARVNYYLAYTKDFKYDENTEGILKNLYVSAGVGMGRFSRLSPIDTMYHPNSKATYVFGAAAYRINKSFTYRLDWDGANMNTGLSFHKRINKVLLFGEVAACNLTNYTGDGIFLLATGGFAFQFYRNNKDKAQEKMLEQNEIRKPEIEYY